MSCKSAHRPSGLHASSSAGPAGPLAARHAHGCPQHGSVQLQRLHARLVRCAAATVAAPTPFKKAKLNQDYAAVASDVDVLKRPLKDELTPAEVTSVFGYSRDLRDWYV